MVTFRPVRPGRLADVPAFDRGIGGAESNVACTLARAGHRVQWISRVGDDGFGAYLTREIERCGVDTSAVRRDPERPTGIYFRTAGERATAEDAPEREGAPDGPLAEVAYYRAGSAASAMSPASMAPYPDTAGTRVLHLSGITAALSADCLALMREMTARRPGRPLVSFDVNYRVNLWDDAAEAGATLKELARGADLVFVGEDEAEAAWGITGGPDAIRAALPEPAMLVVKQGSTGATLFETTADAGTGTGTSTATGTKTYAPALTVDVTAPVGAGDAFAAGFLSATLRALPATQRLRHGHLFAAAALTVPGDMAAPPGHARAGRLAALSDADWGTLRLGPGWTMTGADGEVVTV
ncbi:sugar kinase [Streptomyces sp. NPDC050418]|uniref:sugar kinase n=1 Tax=Streptomyces sp. NPDC050418 TaxID=3365612 RepID=UPI003788775C